MVLRWRVWQLITIFIFNYLWRYKMDKQDYFELISRASDDLLYLEQNSKEYSYLHDFSEHYNHWRRMANEFAKSAEDYAEAIADLDRMVDKVLKRKLSQQYTEDVLDYYHYIDDIKGEVGNKYIRYKLFGFSYITFNDLKDDSEQFINKMLITFRNLFKNLPSTERPITDKDLLLPNDFSYIKDYREYSRK